MPSPVTVQFDAVSALAEALRAVSAGLAEEASDCRSAATRLRAGVPDDAGSPAGSAVSAWAGLAELLGRECDSVAVALLAAVESYRAEDAALSAAIEGTLRPSGQGPR
jgi:hypothetical protein